jgi:AcrR family transcriptional regulator
MTDRRTAAAVLDAAEVEFAENGIDHASLRSIMRAAGANTAAVHYHFGSRQELARAVLDRILEPLQRRRIQLLDAALSAADHPSCEVLVDALVRPDFEAVLSARERDPRATRIVGTIYSRPPDFVHQMVEASFAPVAQRFMPPLLAVLPELSATELSWRVRWSVFGMLGAVLSSHDVKVITDQTVGQETDRMLGREIARTVAAAAGSLSAPPTEEIPA